jgi:hypothetical protein
MNRFEGIDGEPIDNYHPEGSRGSVRGPNSVPTGDRSNTPEGFALGAMPHLTELPEFARISREKAIAKLAISVSE